MYIDKKLLKILETHKGENIDVNFMIGLIKTAAKEHETEQLKLTSVSNRRELLIAFQEWVKKDSKGFFTIELSSIERFLKSNL